MIKSEMGQIKSELRSQSGLVSGTRAAGPATDLSTAASESILRLQLEQVVMVMSNEQPCRGYRNRQQALEKSKAATALH